MDVEVRGKVRRWGNSLALRLRKQDVDRLGLREGQELHAVLRGFPDKVDLGKIPTFHGGKPMDWSRREEIAGEGYWLLRQGRE